MVNNSGSLSFFSLAITDIIQSNLIIPEPRKERPSIRIKMNRNNKKTSRQAIGNRDVKVAPGCKLVTITTQSGRHFKLELEDSLPIEMAAHEPETGTPTLPLLGEVRGLAVCIRLDRHRRKPCLLTHYYGSNENSPKDSYVSLDSQQACLLLALCGARNNQLPIGTANRILNDKKRCRRPPAIIDPVAAVQEVVKNLRKTVGFTSKELYFSRKASIVGLKSITQSS